MGLFSSLGKLAGFIPGVGPIAAAGLGLAGSVIDGKRQNSAVQQQSNQQAEADHARSKDLMDYQKQLNELDLGKLSAEARENGFNPLTALGVTGGQTSNVGLSNTLGSGDFITDAMDRSVDNWYNSEPLFNTSEEDGIRLKMMQEELKDLQRRNEAPLGGFGYSIPQITTTSRNSNAQSAELTMERAEAIPREDTSLTMDFRTGVNGDRSYTGLNPDAWEIGIGELAGGSLVHGGSFLMNKSNQLRSKFQQWHDDEVFPYAMPPVPTIPDWAKPFKKNHGDKSRFRQ